MFCFKLSTSGANSFNSFGFSSALSYCSSRLVSFGGPTLPWFCYPSCRRSCSFSNLSFSMSVWLGSGKAYFWPTFRPLKSVTWSITLGNSLTPSFENSDLNLTASSLYYPIVLLIYCNVFVKSLFYFFIFYSQVIAANRFI